MATVQSVWGVDVGRCALKALKLRVGADRKVEIVAHEYIEHEKILSQPDADRHELISTALEQFLSRNDLSKDKVYVSVPGQHTLARFSKLPPVQPKRIPDIVRYEADQQIPFDMDEVIWDYQTFQEEGMPDLEVGIFAMKRELIREHLLHFEQASIEPVGVQAAPLAVYNAALFDGLVGSETTILLDIGSDSTDVVIATPTRLWSRTVAIGGNHFTEALVKAFKLTFAKAEALKRTASTSKYSRQVFQAMRPIFADIVQELQRSIGFYSSTHREAKFEKLMGVGNAFLLPGLEKYLQQNLGMPVELPTTFGKASMVEGAELPASLKEQLLSFWVAYGLALQGLDLTKVTTSLLPTEIAKQVVWRKKRPAFAAAAACLVLAGSTIWFRKTSDMRSLAAAGGGVEPKLSVEQAASVVDGSAGSGQTDYEKTTTILAAGRALGQAFGSFSGKGEKEHKEGLSLVDFVGQRGLVPQIVRAIHEALPIPEGALATATNQAQVLEAIGSAPRADRRQVHIQAMVMDYVQDLNNPIWPSSLADAEEPINDFKGGKVVPGILIKIVCTTPNQGRTKFLEEAFLSVLRKNSRKPGLGFYFDRTWIIRGNAWEGGKPTIPGTGLRSGGQPPKLSGGTKGGRSGGSGASSAGVGSEEELDPLTNEPIDGDFQFEVWIDAVLSEYSEGGEKEAPEPPKPKPKPPKGDKKGP
ncbi:MAG: type IV pilus assembly protein PilM [Planctomycetota bacterium]